MKRKIVAAIFSVVISTIVMGQRVTLNIPNGHANNIEQIATTSDGKYVASVSSKTVIVWDVVSRKKIHEINLNISLSASETSTLAITDQLDKVVLSANSGLFCYNIQTGKEIFTNGTATSGGAFSKDGSKVYAIDYGTLHVFDAASGKQNKYIIKAVDNTSSDCKFYELGDNRLLIVHHYGWSIVNIVTDEIIFKKTFENIYAEKLDGYDFSKKDNLIIGFRDEYLISFDVLTGAAIKKKTPAADPSGLSINAKGELVLFSRDYKAKKYITELLKTTDFSLIKTSSQPDAEVPEQIFYATHCMPLPGTNKIIFNNDKLVYQFDTEEGSYNNAYQNKITDFKEFYYYSNLTERLLPDNNLTFSTEDYGVRDFDMETFKPGKYIPASASVVMSPDGKLAAGIGKKITLTSLATGKLIKILQLPEGIDPKIEFFFFNYDNTKLIYTDKFKGSINAIDINTGVASKIVTLGAFFGEESASYDGKYFACNSYVTNAGSENYIKVYNLKAKQVVLTKKTANIHELQFLNDSYYLFAHMQNINIFKADDPTFISSFAIENLNDPIVMGGDIKNNIIAIGEGDRISVYKIWLVTLQGKVLKTFQSETNNNFLKAAFSKDDKIMFTPTTKKGIQVWNTENGELLGTYYFIEKTNEYIFVSPEGLFDGSVDGMKELYFVKNNKPIPLEKLYEKNIEKNFYFATTNFKI